MATATAQNPPPKKYRQYSLYDHGPETSQESEGTDTGNDSRIVGIRWEMKPGKASFIVFRWFNYFETL